MGLFGLRNAARATASEEDSRRLITAEEEEALAKMKMRDKEIDQQLDELDKGLGRLQDIGEQIGRTAERQKKKAEAMTEEVDKVQGDIQGMSKKVSEVMKYEKNTNCCCQLILV